MHTINLTPGQVDELLEVLRDSENEGPMSGPMALVFNQLTAVSTNPRWIGVTRDPEE